MITNVCDLIVNVRDLIANVCDLITNVRDLITNVPDLKGNIFVAKQIFLIIFAEIKIGFLQRTALNSAKSYGKAYHNLKRP